MVTSRSDNARRGSVYLGLAGGLMVASGALLGGYYLIEDGSPPALASASEPSSRDNASARAAAAELVDREVTVRVHGRETAMRWSELGVRVDEAVPGQSAVGPRRGAIAVRVDRNAAIEALEALKERFDESARDARIDLEARTIVDERPGWALDVYKSLTALNVAARDGADEVELDGTTIPALVTRAGLGIDDVSHVLGSFTTKFAVADKERNYNLKLAASKLNGYIMEPGEKFSFNDVVGPRTEKEGYKIAHVITAGEMVDGLAGGTCQISTTLHGAAFFAGLGIDVAQPHSRPSTYVTPGLDATVVYPQVDMVMHNPYEFPVVISFRVARGEAKVEILGAERPYDKIAFEREIDQELPFHTVTREDKKIPIGSMLIDQYGFPGYKVTRMRHYYKSGKLVKTDKWKIQYRPVTEYVRTGTNPNPNLEPPEQEPKKNLTTPEGNGLLTQ